MQFKQNNLNNLPGITDAHAGVRQFFHRMVVCLEEDILSFVPTMVNLMLATPDAKELYDFIPMLNQLITKFKVSCVTGPCHVFHSIFT